VALLSVIMMLFTMAVSLRRRREGGREGGRVDICLPSPLGRHRQLMCRTESLKAGGRKEGRREGGREGEHKPYCS